MNMKCMDCQGEMKKGTAPFHNEVDVIQAMIRSLDEKARELKLTA